MPRLEYKLYYWLGLPVVLLFTLMTVLMMYEATNVFISDSHGYSNIILDEGAEQIGLSISGYETYAGQWIADFHLQMERGIHSLSDIDVQSVIFDKEGLQFLIFSLSDRITRYRRHIQGTSIVMTAERLGPDDPISATVGKRFSVTDTDTGWDEIFRTPGSDWLMPYAVRLPDIGLMLMLVPLKEFHNRLEALHNSAEISTFLALTEWGKNANGGADSGIQDYLRTVDRSEIVLSGPPHWSELLAGLEKVTLYYPKPLLPGMYIGLSYDVLALYDRLRRHLVLGLVMSFLGITLLYVIIRRGISYFSDSITDLHDQLEIVSSGNLDVQLPENQRYREMTFITRMVNQLLRQLKGYVNELQQETERSAALASEIAIAGRIQQDLLVYDVDRIAGDYRIDLGVLLAPAKKIAGDFYCLAPRPDGKLLFAVGDVSGKGIAAALVAKDCVSLFDMYGQDLAPAQLLQQMNADLFDRFARQSMFVTMFCCMLDTENGVLAHCDAGHETPLLYRAGDREIGRVDVKRNMALGFLPDTRYEESSMKLETDQTLLLYTDGLEGSLDKPDGASNLPLGVDLLGNSLLRKVDMQTRIQCINNLALRRQGGEAYDDITLLGISLERSEYRSFNISPEPREVGNAISRLRAILEQEQVPANCVNNLSVILDEWVSNLVRYADVDSDIIVSSRCSPYAANLEICADCESSINPLHLPELDVFSHLQSYAAGGFGIHIIRNLADDASYETQSGWVRLNVRVNTENAGHATQS